MSPRWNWDSPTPLAASEFALPPLPKGGGGAHSPAAKGVGESQFQRLEKRLALCLLCAFHPPLLSVSSAGDTHEYEKERDNLLAGVRGRGGEGAK
jgi:hypothetical protein